MVGATEERQALVCEVCQTYVATAKKDAPQEMVARAFHVAVNIHLLTMHPNVNKDDITFSYGMRSD